MAVFQHSIIIQYFTDVADFLIIIPLKAAGHLLFIVNSPEPMIAGIIYYIAVCKYRFSLLVKFEDYLLPLCFCEARKDAHKHIKLRRKEIVREYSKALVTRDTVRSTTPQSPFDESFPWYSGCGDADGAHHFLTRARL